ncbi:TIGR04104 family putative zinc finger protein [Bacillus sp. 2205SS5-2]|uniref:TIGR04104 family putative zinc finger protein n=1 Tax=Bacillus sp. 2205SS5-2 TaxID=3109031 RepID=UPI00300496E2
MGIYRCENCRQKFTYFEIMKNIWGLSRKITCRECGSSYRLANKSRFIMMLFFFLPLAIFRINVPDLAMIWTITGMMTLGIGVSFIIPFFMKYERL